jgi:phosphotransferase family enzyme
VFRVALPVYPFCKTASEVATMTYVRRHTDIPIPQVHAYDTSSQNALGHEWLLMDMVDGASTYSQVEETLNVNQKLKIARQLADCVHKLDQLRFSSAGSLYFQDDLRQMPQARSFATASASHPHGLPGRGPVFIDPKDDASICLGPAVSGVFFGDWRNEYEFDRGPYPTVEAFIKGALEMHRLETADHRQQARSDMYAAVDAAWGDPEEDKIAREERLARVRAEWVEMTKAKLGGSLDPCVDWVNDAPWFIREGRFNEFDDATRAALHLTLALEGDDFAMAREDLTANPFSCRLHHWDLAGRNILIDDETGDLRALLDWEQIISLPPYLCGFYPRALLGRGPDRANDELLEPTCPADDAMEDEDEFQKQMGYYRAKLLRDEFRRRLDSLITLGRAPMRPDEMTSNLEARRVCPTRTRTAYMAT